MIRNIVPLLLMAAFLLPKEGGADEFVLVGFSSSSDHLLLLRTESGGKEGFHRQLLEEWDLQANRVVFSQELVSTDELALYQRTGDYELLCYDARQRLRALLQSRYGPDTMPEGKRLQLVPEANPMNNPHSVEAPPQASRLYLGGAELILQFENSPAASRLVANHPRLPHTIDLWQQKPQWVELSEEERLAVQPYALVEARVSPKGRFLVLRMVSYAPPHFGAVRAQFIASVPVSRLASQLKLSQLVLGE